MGNALLAKAAPATVKESESIENEVEPGLIDWKTIWKPRQASVMSPVNNKQSRFAA
jgi:hypothetical protein